jgi:polysaccharide pyruvyl transferase WcaK-like protein
MINSMKNKGKTITVINWAGLNYGDNEIFSICYNMFFKNKYEKINLISDYPQKFSHYEKVNVLTKVFGLKKNWFKIIKAIWQSDKIFCGGGDIIVGDLGTSLLLVVAALLKKDIVIAGVGALSIKSNKKIFLKIKENLERYFLNRAKLICVRDANSKNILKQYTDNEICVYPDLCFLYEHEEYKKYNKKIDENKIGIKLSENERYAAVSIIPPSQMYNNSWGLEEYKTMACVLDKIIYENGIIPIFLTAVSKKDLAKVNYDMLSDDDVIKMVVNEMKYKEKVIFMSDTLNIDEVSFVLNKCEFAVLSRLHFVITAIINRTPFFALDYSPKIHNILKEVKMEKHLMEWPFTNSGEIYSRIMEMRKSEQVISYIDDKVLMFNERINDLYNKLNNFL